jgi:microcin C transport system substrate-binding protein
VQPKYDAGVLDTWWFDAKKAEALASGKPETQPQQQQPAKP